MTSVFKTPSGQYLVLLKGADSIVLPLCKENDANLKDYTTLYADACAK